MKQAKRFEMESLERLLETLWQIDWNSKTGIGEGRIAMETFLVGASSN